MVTSEKQVKIKLEELGSTCQSVEDQWGGAASDGKNTLQSSQESKGAADRSGNNMAARRLERSKQMSLTGWMEGI